MIGARLGKPGCQAIATSSGQWPELASLDMLFPLVGILAEKSWCPCLRPFDDPTIIKRASAFVLVFPAIAAWFACRAAQHL
jgi:hypothetical protein